MESRRRRRREPVPTTDEEKKLYEEMLRLKAEEARKDKEKKLAERLQSRQAEEEEFSQRNLLKINTHWRELMRAAKVESLRRDVSALSQSFARALDRKDALLATLVRDLADGEAQYQLLARAHLAHLDSLVAVHAERVALLERAYERRAAVARADFDAGRSAALASGAAEAAEMRAIMAAMEEEHVDRRTAVETQHHNLVEDLKRTQQEALAAVSSELRTEVLDLYSAFRQAMDNYNMHTENRQTQFKADKRQDKKNAALIARNHRLVRRLQALKDQLRGKIATNDREFDERNKALRDERDAVSGHFLQLKSRMLRFRDGERRRLTELTLASERCIRTLEDRLKVAERVLALAEVTRKLETEEERVLPFARADGVVAAAATAGASSGAGAGAPGTTPDFGPPPSEFAALDAAVSADTAGAGAGAGAGVGGASSGATSADYGYLAGMHRRYNKVLLDRHALELERATLASENSTLKEILQRYLDGISVSPAVIAQANPLVIVNGRTNFERPNPMPGQVIPKTDLQTLVVVERVRS